MGANICDKQGLHKLFSCFKCQLDGLNYEDGVVVVDYIILHVAATYICT